MTAILESRALTKRYKDITAVEDLSFSIASGEIFSLLGPNGAGKTTTIAMLSTLLTPSSGDALIGGHSILTEAMAVRRLIGIVPQDIALYPELSAQENLLFWGRMYDLEGQQLQERVAQTLARIGLTERAKDRISTFSGGMKRRVNIAAGLLHHPRLLFMDEPTVGIDPQSRRAILDLVKELNREGTSILYTTHYMEEAQELSHRVGIIDHGKLIALGTQAELTRQVGENSTLTLTVDEQDPMPALLEALRAVPEISQASGQANLLTLITPRAEAALAAVVTTLSNAGAHIRSVEVHEPNLETVFLHLTGRALRD